MSGEKNCAVSEWLILIGVAVSAIAISKFFGFSHKWENSTVYTILLFTTVIQAERDLWKYPSFWKNLFLILALHVFVWFLILEALFPEARGIPWLLMISAGMIEGILVMGVLRKRTIGSKHVALRDSDDSL